VTVIDGATDRVIATVAVGERPLALCYNPTNNKVYCANADDSSVTVIDGTSDVVVATIGVGAGPNDFAWSPVQNRVYVANYYGSSISVLRDSMAGIEESFRPRAPSRRLEPTVLSGASVQSLKSKVIFDAMGRRVLNPRSGVFFVREAQAVRKVVIQR